MLGKRGGPNFFDSDAPYLLANRLGRAYADTNILDEISWARALEQRWSGSWGAFIPRLIEDQAKAIADGIETWQLHRWKNALPQREQTERDRVELDVQVLHKMKMLNLAHTNQMEHLVAKCDLRDTVVLRHLFYRLMTGTGSHAKDHYPQPSMKEYTPKQTPKTDKGQHFPHVGMVLDYWVDKRDDPETHPIRRLVRLSEVVLDPSTQKQLLGEGSPTVFDNIGILDHDHDRLPRLCKASEERSRAFLRYLEYMGVGAQRPKHTALYFADRQLEPFAQVFPPIQTPRHALDRWARHYHQMLFIPQHTCSSNKDFLQQLAYEECGQKKRSCHLDTLKKRFVAAAGHDPNVVPFEAMAHTESYYTWTDGYQSGYADVQGMLGSSSSTRKILCFHRKAHTCLRCCALDPVQELFVARTSDAELVVGYHPMSPSLRERLSQQSTYWMIHLSFRLLLIVRKLVGGLIPTRVDD